MAGERTLPGIGLTGFWDLGSAYKDGMDSNLRLLSALSQIVVEDRDAALPGTPSTGDIYIVDSGDGTHPNEIAVWDGPVGSEQWYYITPQAGWIAYVKDEGAHYRFDGSGWTPLVTSGAMVQSEETSDFSITNAHLAGNNVIRANFSAAGDVTVQAGLTGTEPVTVIATGTADVTFVEDTGVTINSAGGNLKLTGQFSAATR